jgi:Domain of unknown function (DUF1906)
MTITANVVQAPAGLIGVDTIGVLDTDSAQRYLARGYRFCIRYVSHDRGPSEYVDLTASEAQTIVDSGLALMAVQHPLDAGWVPTADLGQIFGQNAALHATEAGLPPGVNVWLDLEGVAPGTPAADVIAFCNAWFQQVESAGFASGIYVGANPGLSADELYWDIRTQHYWKGGSSAEAGVPDDIPPRGYQLVQRIHDPGPREYDSDVTRTDTFGGGVMWAVNG